MKGVGGWVAEVEDRDRKRSDDPDQEAMPKTRPGKFKRDLSSRCCRAVYCKRRECEGS